VARPADSSNPLFGSNAVAYSRLISIDPGVCQVRVAARDPRTGRVGSAHQWLDVPRIDASPLPSGKIQLSSVFLKRPQSNDSPGTRVSYRLLDENEFSVKRRFPAGSRLSLMLQICNAVSPPVVRTKIYRGNRAIVESAPQSLKDLIPDITGPVFVDTSLPLKGLSPGAYVLEVSATDPSMNTMATQRVSFWIQ
jgi:hypothetical protein